jgi:hypothetical protein
LQHRVTGDIDLFSHQAEEMRTLVGVLSDVAASVQMNVTIVRDAGIDPGVLAWLLARFPVEPLPKMLQPLTVEKLQEFRDALAERLKRSATP